MMPKESVFDRLLESGHTMDEIRKMPFERFIEATGLEPRTIGVKIRGVRYACLDVAYWDPEKKKATHKRQTIGYYDDDGNLIRTGSSDDRRARTMPKPEQYAVTKEIGCTMLMDSIARRIGLWDTVESAFGDDTPYVMTCAYFLASHSDALCHCEQWSAGAETPANGRLADQRIAELLMRITEDRRMRFFREWTSKLGDDENYAIDITSISSYSETITEVRAGYNRDKESLEQINLALMVGSKSRLPGYYSILPGNIVDKASLKRFIHTLVAFGFTRFSIVMDKGFYTKENIDECYRLHQKFVVSMENKISRADDIIARHRSDISVFDNYIDTGTSKVYGITEIQNWEYNGKNHRCYTHLFFDPQKANDDRAHFLEKLNAVRDGILAGDETYISSPMAKKYLNVKKYNGRCSVTSNQDAIEKHLSRSGFLVIISNHVKDARKVLKIYRDKETAESGFDDMKNSIDCHRLRIHTGQAMQGKVFLVFLSLILKLEMSNVMEQDRHLRSISREEVLREMSILRKTTLGVKNVMYTERTKLQKAVIKAFGICTEFRDEIELEPPLLGSTEEPS